MEHPRVARTQQIPLPVVPLRARNVNGGIDNGRSLFAASPLEAPAVHIVKTADAILPGALSLLLLVGVWLRASMIGGVVVELTAVHPRQPRNSTT
jgi:hypothetical protein